MIVITPPIFRKQNHTYVMTHPATGEMNYWCGFPDDPDGCHAEVEAYIAEHPEALVDEPKPPEPTAEQKAQAIRSQRNALLGACDWTMLPDAPVPNAPSWHVYRKALRDVTDQATFPDSVEWPKKPE